MALVLTATTGLDVRLRDIVMRVAINDNAHGCVVHSKVYFECSGLRFLPGICQKYTVDGVLRMRIEAGPTCTQKLLAALFLYVALHIIASCVYNRFSGVSIHPLPIANLTFLSTYYLVDSNHPIVAQNQCVLPTFVGPLLTNKSVVSFVYLESKWTRPPTSNFTVVTRAKHLNTSGAWLRTMSSQTFAPKDMDNGRIIWTPVKCRPQQTAAIIVPFRNRYANLSVFLNHMHPFLRHQQLAYTIYVIDQRQPKLFNRGALLNIGFLEASKRHPYSCFIFHDVDLLPEDDRNLYTCEAQPLHLSVAIDKFAYNLFYESTFGGAVAMTATQFNKTHGFPNSYFGWGGEDDDMSRRLTFARFKLTRRDLKIARYTMLKHTHEAGNAPNPRRYKRLAEARKLWKNDTFQSVKYRVLQHSLRHSGLYYYLQVDLLLS
ncbi:Beta-1,4-galactosyltransferase 3 [Sparganum proliferum]